MPSAVVGPSSYPSPLACLEFWRLVLAVLRLSGHRAPRRSTSARRACSPTLEPLARLRELRIVCHASQSARVLHVPTITLLSGFSAGRGALQQLVVLVLRLVRRQDEVQLGEDQNEHQRLAPGPDVRRQWPLVQ
jgi:hypothetical protein